MYWAIIVVSLFYECLAANSKDLAPWLNELSAQNLASLIDVNDKNYNQNQPKGYWHIDPEKFLRAKEEKKDQDSTEKGQFIVNNTIINPGLHVVNKGCYTLQLTWRRARTDFHRYFNLREYYENTHMFEIGYLTHVIVSKYMNMLELYEMVDTRFMQNPTKNYAPAAWVWYMYINILEYSRSIIHWCNMMHEIKAKFGVESGTSKDGSDYESMSTPDPEEMEIGKYLKNIQDNYQEAMAKKKKRMLEARLRYKYGIRKPAANLSTTRTKRPPQFWKWRTGTAGRGKEYGWSIEEFFTNYN